MIGPQLSVVVPVRDRADLIGAAVGSLLADRSPALEVIVVDDASTDATRRVVQALALEDPRVRLLTREKSGGGPPGRHPRGAPDRGVVLAFLDSDDLVAPGRLARHAAKLSTRPELAAVAGAMRHFRRTDAGGRPVPDPETVAHHSAILQSTTFRTVAFRAIGPLDESLPMADDVDFFLRAIEAGTTVLLETEIAFYYRRHEANLTADDAQLAATLAGIYARSLARRRASENSHSAAPLTSWFGRTIEREEVFAPGAAA
jgi:glycosyltransferase involved in cell wall biosynthesis